MLNIYFLTAREKHIANESYANSNMLK